MRMKILSIHWILIISSSLGFSQIDTTQFVGAEYPTGTTGFYRDLEAFASISSEDKEYLSKTPAEIYMEISLIGTLLNAEIRNNIDSSLHQRIIKALYKLHDFKHATYEGEPIESTLQISFTYEKAPGNNPVLWKSSSNKMVIELGGFVGGFAGNISDNFGINGGMALGWGVNFDNTIINLEFALIASKKNGDFYLPPEVVRESNNAIGLIGIGVGKEYKLNSGNAWRIKGTVHYGFLNVGFKSDDSLYRLTGISPGLELGYHIPLSRLKPGYQYFNPDLGQHGILLYTGLQKFYLQGTEADGWSYAFGVKYLLSTYGAERVSE